MRFQTAAASTTPPRVNASVTGVSAPRTAQNDKTGIYSGSGADSPRLNGINETDHVSTEDIKD